MHDGEASQVEVKLREWYDGVTSNETAKLTSFEHALNIEDALRVFEEALRGLGFVVDQDQRLVLMRDEDLEKMWKVENMEE